MIQVPNGCLKTGRGQVDTRKGGPRTDSNVKQIRSSERFLLIPFLSCQQANTPRCLSNLTLFRATEGRVCLFPDSIVGMGADMRRVAVSVAAGGGWC